MFGWLYGRGVYFVDAVDARVKGAASNAATDAAIGVIDVADVAKLVAQSGEDNVGVGHILQDERGVRATKRLPGLVDAAADDSVRGQAAGNAAGSRQRQDRPRMELHGEVEGEYVAESAANDRGVPVRDRCLADRARSGLCDARGEDAQRTDVVLVLQRVKALAEVNDGCSRGNLVGKNGQAVGEHHEDRPESCRQTATAGPQGERR